MTRAETIIGVNDVQGSSIWYQALLECRSSHGGDTFEILTNSEDVVVLCLHKWGEHHHPTLMVPNPEIGNGLILYFRVDDLQKVWKTAQELNAVIEQPPHYNPNSEKEEFSLRDPDGYYIIVSL
jgi:hypothetical protein